MKYVNKFPAVGDEVFIWFTHKYDEKPLKTRIIGNRKGETGIWFEFDDQIAYEWKDIVCWERVKRDNGGCC